MLVQAGAYNDGRHKNASRNSQAGSHGHESQVYGSHKDEGAQREIAVVACAHLLLGAQRPQAEQVLDSLVRVGKEERCQIIELP